MAQNVADLLWDLLYQAGVRRCYGIVGDALNPILDALHRNGKIDFIHVRHEEYAALRRLSGRNFERQPSTFCGSRL